MLKSDIGRENLFSHPIAVKDVCICSHCTWK